MKKAFLIWLLCFPAAIITRNGNAQQVQTNAQTQTQDQSGLDKVRAAEVAYLSEKMNLTPEEGEKFWPVYNNYTQEMQQLIEERKQALNATGPATDAQADQSLKDEFTFREKALAIQEKYKSDFLSVLPAKKVAIFYKAREEFRNKVVDELNRRQSDKNQKNNRNNNMGRPHSMHVPKL